MQREDLDDDDDGDLDEDDPLDAIRDDLAWLKNAVQNLFVALLIIGGLALARLYHFL